MARQPPRPETEIEKVRRESLITDGHAGLSLAGDLLKWTLGSLLVVNGGALVALIGADDLRKDAFNEAALLFGGGMIAALLGGLCMAFTVMLTSTGELRRAWDSKPIAATALARQKLEPAVRNWGIGAIVLWLLSFTLFAFGCISTANLPQQAEWERLRVEATEAVTRYTAETNRLTQLRANPNATREQLEAAEERARAAGIDARLKNDRWGRSLGQPAEPMNLLDINSPSNSRKN
jgi:hypothetical protein